MRKILLVILSGIAYAGTVAAQNIPIQRQIFHDNIDKEQTAADKFDGKADNHVKVGDDESVNLQATNALLKQVDAIQLEIERDTALDHRGKVKYLTGLQQVLRDYNMKRAYRRLDAADAPAIVAAYKAMMLADIKGKSIYPIARTLSFEAGEKLVEVFHDNPGYKDAKGEMFAKFAFKNLDDIMPKLGPYLDYPVTDSVIAAVAKKYPNKVLTYATSYTPTASAIRRNPDPLVQQIVQIGRSPHSARLMPFIDQCLNGTASISDLESKVANDEQYFKMLVKGSIELQHMKAEGKNPLGIKSMQENLHARSLRYIREVNDLHDESHAVRFRVVKDFTPEELYYLIVNGQEELFTSSYTNAAKAGLYDQMMLRMKPPRGDSLLMLVGFDRFKKFIAMAAGFNTLDNFLKSMDPENANYLMVKFVRSLEKTEDLEDAVDVANSFGSIRDPKLLDFLRTEVKKNLVFVTGKKDKRGMTIYGLLNNIFTEDASGGSDSAKATDMAAKLQLPPINYVEYASLPNDSGRVYQQVFFYGDEDGLTSYNSFMGNFPRSEWSVTQNAFWVTISSLKGKPITIFANRPLKEPEDKTAIEKLAEYLDEKDIHPTVFVHRGHSYHVNTTLDNLQSTARIVVLGSCGGYHNLATVLEKAPEAHIISSKQVGTYRVNEPIIRSLEETIRAGKNVDWVNMWAGLSKKFAGDPGSKTLFDDYVPPHKNLGAIFIKAYRQIMKDTE
ncbi:hypothetical protein ACWKWU_10245 [Chitinophaga lutea]